MKKIMGDLKLLDGCNRFTITGEVMLGAGATTLVGVV